MASNLNIPIQSSTIIVIRDSAQGIEVLMTERNPQMEFGAGALVFPGGKVETEDTRENHTIIDYVLGGLEVSKITALRELFEETGLLYAVTKVKKLVTTNIQEILVQKFKKSLNQSGKTFAQLLRKEDLTLDLSQLLFVGHWITPEISPQRFNTKFFLTEAPTGQSLFLDKNEVVTADWLTPMQIIEREKKGTVTLMFPTKLNILKLARFKTVKEALLPQNWHPVIEVTPYTIKRRGERWLTIPPNAGYEFFEVKESDIFEFAGIRNAGKQKKL